jgi:drug/metabolite transporter (DMT)-like permease
MKEKGSAHSSRFVGTIAVLGSLLFFVGMNLSVKYLNAHPSVSGRPVPAEEKVFFRMLVGIVAIFILVRIGVVKWRFGNIPLLAARGIVGAAAVLSYFYSIDHTTLARASFLLFTWPAWGALFSYLFLKESLGWRRVPGVVVIYTGAALLLFAGHSSADAQATLAGDLAGVFCGMISAVATTIIRACHRYDTTWIILFFFCAGGAVAGGGIMLVGGTYVAPSNAEWLLLLAVGAMSLGAHILFTTGFRHLDVTTTGALAMLQAPLTAVAAYYFLREELGSYTMLGGGLVLAGGLYLAWTTRANTMKIDAAPTERAG